MKRFLPVIFALFLSICINLHASELGKRYLKLGNSYREANNYSKAEEYLNTASNMLKGDIYWQASANEYLSYLYRDMVKSGKYSNNSDYFLALAKEKMEKALISFQKVVKQPDGSPIPVADLLASLDEINKLIDKEDLTNTGNDKSPKKASYNNSKIINLDNSKLKALPYDFPAKMENLSAANNRIKEISSSLVQFPNLKYLNLDNNKITSIDNSLSGLKGLKFLNLSNNKIKNISENIALLNQLEVLDLSNNRLKSIPNSITALKNLKILDISANKIEFSQISTLIKNMPNTNIIFDKYERVDESLDEEQELIDSGLQGK